MASIAASEISKGVGTGIVDLSGGSLGGISTDTVIEAAKGNDELALNIAQSIGIGLGLRTAYLINLFGPQIVVIGGGPDKAGEILLGPLKNAVGKLALVSKSKGVKIIPSALGADSVCLGAAALAGTRAPPSASMESLSVFNKCASSH